MFEGRDALAPDIRRSGPVGGQAAGGELPCRPWRRHFRYGMGSKGNRRPLMQELVGPAIFEGRDALGPVSGRS